VAFLLRIDAAAKRQLPANEVRYLPVAADIVRDSQLGRTVFGSFKIVLWRSLCDPRSEICQAWFTEGLGVVLNRYFATAVSAMFLGLGIGVKALAVSATALVIKLGLETYCIRFKPDGIMDARRSD
jgi:hypothetical protein